MCIYTHTYKLLFIYVYTIHMHVYWCTKYTAYLQSNIHHMHVHSTVHTSCITLRHTHETFVFFI
jgi:hypothetical protein